jgi:hypothetical protein
MKAALQVSRRERRTVIVGTIIVAAVLLVTRIIPAWTAWIDGERTAAASLMEELDAAQVTVDSLPALLDTLIARNDRYLALAPALVAGETPSAAGVALMSFISGAVTSAGLKPGATQLRVNPSGGSVFSRISIRGSAEGDVRGVSQFLLAVERGPTLLTVRQLSISQPDPGAGVDRPEALRIEFTVEGLALDSTAVRVQAASFHQTAARHLRVVP